ncbi:opine dehydrogenase-like [Dreissena polymorpha]|uniref:Opine dehydrogenase domain-containing protein n=1 Tax=Dreissena polymorpha TaxID=45954 RepID=A0A9D4BGQ0_DREPO|nr:opine dehydrogenase-like [Dreissena polymorpha]XP_052257647.1 opine dehydrogenase-like [Dreissena polymorpha]KAH3694840.1 hypothetical protein DPMN_082281 [Dreissena polymorpha]
MDTPIRILICGGGNGAHTISALASSRPNVEVNVLTLFADEALRWKTALGDDHIVIKAHYSDGTQGEIRGKPRLITNDPAEAMKDVDVVFFVVPAFAHKQYFEAIQNYINNDTIIVGMPGQAGFEFQALSSMKRPGHSAILSLDSMPWACRIVEFGRNVEILGFKDILGPSVIAGTGNYKLPPLQYVQRILGEKPNLQPVDNYLAVSLMADACVHPPMMYGRWKDWDGTPLSEKPLFYQGVDEIQEDLLSKVSDEIVATAKAIQQQRPELDMSTVIHLFDWYKKYYPDQISDKSSLRSCMVTNKAYNGLVYPMKSVDGGFVPDFGYRYTSEDIPFGLVVMKGIAECAGVKTPTMDIIIEWAQKKLGKEYIVGSTLSGRDVGSSRAPQAFGFKTLHDLCSVL